MHGYPETLAGASTPTPTKSARIDVRPAHQRRHATSATDMHHSDGDCYAHLHADGNAEGCAQSWLRPGGTDRPTGGFPASPSLEAARSASTTRINATAFRLNEGHRRRRLRLPGSAGQSLADRSDAAIPGMAAASTKPRGMNVSASRRRSASLSRRRKRQRGQRMARMPPTNTPMPQRPPAGSRADGRLQSIGFARWHLEPFEFNRRNKKAAQTAAIANWRRLPERGETSLQVLVNDTGSAEDRQKHIYRVAALGTWRGGTVVASGG